MVRRSVQSKIHRRLRATPDRLRPLSAFRFPLHASRFAVRLVIFHESTRTFRMSRRSRAREVALQALHQLEFNEPADPAAGERRRRGFLLGRLRSPALAEFADSLVAGVRSHLAALDAALDARSANWRVSRMAATDRTVLRIAAYELLHTDTPGPVVVDEAIELSRRYGSAASPRFVAGLLGEMLAGLTPRNLDAPEA